MKPCPYCKKRKLLNRRNAKTCGKPECKEKHTKAMFQQRYAPESQVRDLKHLLNALKRSKADKANKDLFPAFNKIIKIVKQRIKEV